MYDSFLEKKKIVTEPFFRGAIWKTPQRKFATLKTEPVSGRKT